MIQRIQTLYLLAVALLHTALFFPSVAPLAVHKIKQPESADIILKSSVINIVSTEETEKVIEQNTLLSVLVIAIIIISSVTVFSYKKRLLQIKLGKLNMLITVALTGIVFFHLDNKIKYLAAEHLFSTTYLLGTYLPLISLFLIYLANRAVKKDEELVRAADRLR